MPRYYTFPAEKLEDFTAEVFQYYNVPEADARLSAEVLLYSDLRGIDSHGVARLSTYCGLLEIGRINPRPNIKIARERKATATVDGDNGLGLVVGPKAMETAMEKAAECGTGWAAVYNTNHFGAAGYYPVQALSRDQIGWANTNTTKAVTPLWGAERMLGTNPIAIAFPCKTEPPVVIDLATSLVSYGKIEIAWREGHPVPEGWILDVEGYRSTDPLAMIEGGSLLPLGSTFEQGGHKGYCLTAMVDILTGVLSGANWGPFVPPFAVKAPYTPGGVGKGIGHFFGSWDIESFRDVEEFKENMDHWVQTMRATRPQPGFERVRIPGDPEREALAERQIGGIPVIEAVLRDLEEVSRKTGVKLTD
ncbi:MAG: Ldh family oxidoreductase [Bacteroidia bacterium]|nr:Ldh family oxidoreductase [Bacteroidia bacterium]